MAKRTIAERGRRIGESHPRAKLSKYELELIEELAKKGLNYRQIAKRFSAR